MVSMVNEEQLKRMTPEQRVRNGYESLYFGAPSGDPEGDDMLREALLDSFAKHDVTFDDGHDDATLRRVFIAAYADATTSLQGFPVTPDQQESLTRSFIRFEMSNGRFIENTAKAFENRYDGETLDLKTIVNRFDKDLANEELPDLDAMEADAFENRHDGETVEKAGLSYGAKASTQPTAVKRTYAQRAAESEAVAELKREHDVDDAYDAYSRNHPSEAAGRAFTAGDGYGFDERDDDGPEL